MDYLNRNRPRTKKERDNMAKSHLGKTFMHSQETKDKIGKANRGKNRTPRPVRVNGIEYPSISSAMRDTGMGYYRVLKESQP